MNDFTEILTYILSICLFVSVIVLGSRWLSYNMQTPGELARVEQLRHDVEDAYSLDPDMLEVVIGQATRANQDIKYWQKYRQIWWSKWAIPDEWDDVKLIELPKGE